MEIKKCSKEYEKEIYNFVFHIMINEIKKTPKELKEELVDLENINQYYKENFWLVINENKIIATIGLAIKEDRAEIKRVYVAKDFRCKGIGTLLYKELEKTALKNNIHNLYLRVGIQLLKAHKFYEKLGFCNCGISKSGNSYVYKKKIGEQLKYIGSKEKDIEYRKRPGSYAIIINHKDDKVGIVIDGKDYVFLGGGIEEGETKIDALRRELIEESGYSIKNIKEFEEVGSYVYDEAKGHLEVIANVYIAEFDKKVAEPVEKDHVVLWVEAEEYVDKMFREWQRYIMKKFIEDRRNK